METLRPRRIFVSGLYHETNTFVEQVVGLDHFTIHRGAEIFGLSGNDSPMDGFLHAASEFGWEVEPGVLYQGAPSGPASDDVLEMFWKDLHARLHAALGTGLDAIFLILHGAMATESVSDAEGEILQRIRRVEGAGELPIFAVLDLHANVSERMAECATALVVYRENPHVDARETAVRAARHLGRLLAERLPLRTYYMHSRILLAPTATGTGDDPMFSLERMARDLEKSGNHLEVGIAAGFAHADTPDTGLALWVVSTEPEANCREALENLLREARRLARNVSVRGVPISEALQCIERDRAFPALLVEPADNIGGGAPGDTTFVLRALLGSSFENGGVIINDPETVHSLRAVSPGETVRVHLGGKGSRFDPGPVELDFTLIRLTDGKFRLEDRRSHLASMTGNQIDMGPCAVGVSRNVTILVTSRPTPPFDLAQWRSQGVEPSELEVIGVKAAVAHRRAYDLIARSSYTVLTPGPGTSDLTALPYRNIRRPVYPLDAL
jgi:microcystin degradation protein MlrC